MRAVQEPDSLEAARAVVLEAARERVRVQAIGSGSKLDWLVPPEPAAVELRTRGLGGVVAYEPGDGTITARCGTLWSELVEVTARHGHHLSPEVSAPEHATLGGVIAAGQSGIDRLRHGPVRHQVLGLQVLLADGTLARSGGRLVKNVTGFDVHRLHTGAHGSLGVIVEASLRLYPAPEERAIATLACTDRGEALRSARHALEPPVGALAVMAFDGALLEAGDGVQLAILLAARAEVLPHQLRELGARQGGLEIASGDAARARWSSYRDLERAPGRWADLRVGCLPSRCGATWDLLVRAAQSAGARAQVLAHPGIATLDAWIDGTGAAVLSVAADLRATGSQVHVRGARASSTPPAGADVMRRLRSALDPVGLWATRLEGLER